MNKTTPTLIVAMGASVLLGATAFAGPQRGEGQGHGSRGAEKTLAMLYAADADGDANVTRAEVSELQAAEFAFRDRDEDGVLTIADQSPTRQRLKAKREADREGRPDRPERERMAKEGPHAERAAAMKAAREDGQVTREEFDGLWIAQFEYIDADQDDVITPDELDDLVERRVERRMTRRAWWR